MTYKFTKFNNDDRAFSGLEAAIVLIAFVVVAAVFSLAVLNAGFFATQEATGAVHTGLAEATSSLQLGGDVVAAAHVTGAFMGNVTIIEVPVMLAAGGRPIDLSLNRTLVSYVDSTHSVRNLHRNLSAFPEAGNRTVNLTWSLRLDPPGAEDNILERGEVAVFHVPVFNATIPAEGITARSLILNTHEVFTITVQPGHGAALSVERRIPALLEGRMVLRMN